MPLLINLRHLEKHSLRLEGELPPGELDLDLRDDLVRAEKPLEYDLEVELMEDGLLVQGHLRLPLQCLCVRCLKPFEFQLKLEDWVQLLPMKGEEQVELLQLDRSGIRVASYLTDLPPKDILQRRLRAATELARRQLTER